MNMMRILLAPVLVVVMALPAAAEKLSLSALSQYLNNLRTATGAFTQINGDGTISTGTIYINRPGRIRFEYAPPDDTLVIAGSSSVAIFDAKSNTGPETYPLARTPLSIILADTVNLGQARMVVGHTYDGTATTVTAQDPDNPDYGNIQLVFTGNPIQLRQWLINDDAGNSTTVVLGDMQTGTAMSASLFNIQLEANRRSSNR
ncbi:MAG: LolA family protein [Paracoccaceae bacterium]